MANALYFGDNLEVLRESIKDESVDLIYLDPPFNSNATYNVLFKTPKGHQSEAQIEAFDDTWHWGPHAARRRAVCRGERGSLKMLPESHCRTCGRTLERCTTFRTNASATQRKSL